MVFPKKPVFLRHDGNEDWQQCHTFILQNSVVHINQEMLLQLTCEWHTNQCFVGMQPVSTAAMLDLSDSSLLVPCVLGAPYSKLWQP
jgi:hypothetical protein